MLCTLLHWAARVVVLAALGAASLQDVKRREVDALILLGPIPVLLLLLAARLLLHCNLGRYPLVAVAEDLMVIGLTGALVVLGLKGEGDLVALLLVALADPLLASPYCIFTAAFLTLLYYVTAVTCIAVGFAVVNLLLHRRELRRIRSWKLRILYLFTAIPVEVSKLGRGRFKWWYPLSLCEERATFDIYENPEDTLRKVREAIERGCVAPEDRVWASYGVPALPIILAAYATSLLVGDKPLLALLSLLTAAVPLCPA